MPNENFKKNASVLWPLGIFLFVLLIFTDQIAKNLARSVFYNPAFVFSLPVPAGLIYAIYTVVVAGMVYYVFKNYKKFSLPANVAWVLIFAGAASNIGERIYLGNVRDFIYITFYKWTGVYNTADGYIIVGIILLLFSSTKVIDKKCQNLNN
jgi:lipoprotein signal peptidase